MTSILICTCAIYVTSVRGSLASPPTTPHVILDQIAPQCSNPLTRGSVFMLVTSLALALAFHPFSGSLIYGPTSRYWLLSPFSCVLEMLAVWLRLGEHVAKIYGWRWLYDYSSSVRMAFSLSDAAYAIVAARAMNAPGGERRKALRDANDSDDAMEVIDSAVVGISEGFRFRLAVVFPIVAQFIKIMTVTGVVLPKVLGCVLIAHWFTMESLLLVARPRRNREFSREEMEDVVSRVEELLFLDRRRSHGQQSDDMFEHYLFQLHTWSFLVMSLLLMFFKLWVIALVWLCCARWILPVRCMLVTDNNKRTMKRISRKFSQANSKMSALLAEMQYGGPNVGGDVGWIFFLSWLLFCALYFDSAGTERPDWPWLDWLG